MHIIVQYLGHLIMNCLLPPMQTLFLSVELSENSVATYPFAINCLNLAGIVHNIYAPSNVGLCY